MQRGSDKHGPRSDDALEKDTRSMVQGAPGESRAEEFREQEGPGQQEPTPDARLHGDRGMTPEGTLAADEIEARSEIARHIPGAVFPGTRNELLQGAREMHAPDAILRQIASLPEGRTFENVQDVWTALGGTAERRA
jgi:hypothetical protein